MPIFNAPTDDIKFVLHEILKCETLSALPGYEDASADLIDQIIDEGSKLCQEELFPLNQSGDEEGCHFDNGTVTTPKGFQQAYDLFTEGGWVGLSCDPEYGGMGLPQLVNFVMQEIISAANMSFGMGHTGAYDAIHLHGSDEQKMYCPRSPKVNGPARQSNRTARHRSGRSVQRQTLHRRGFAYLITGQIYISAGNTI